MHMIKLFGEILVSDNVYMGVVIILCICVGVGLYWLFGYSIGKDVVDEDKDGVDDRDDIL